MISRRTLFANAFVAVGFFATRRLAPKVEEETVRIGWQRVPAIQTKPSDEHIFAALRKASACIEWDPKPMEASDG